jgi:putative transposase
MLQMARPRRKFTPEQKTEAVRLARDGAKLQKSTGVMAKELDLTETSLRAWVKQADADEGRGPPGTLTTCERAELSALRKEVRTLRMERELSRRAAGLYEKKSRAKFEFVEAQKKRFPIAVMCAYLAVSSSGFYAWRSRPPSRRELDDARLLESIRAVHAESKGRYGSPRVHRELVATGTIVNRHRVARLMREVGLRGRRRRRFRRTTDSEHAMPVAPNTLGRNFMAAAPNQVWVADITWIPTREGPLYLAAVLDLCSRRVVGWAISARITGRLTIKALAMALRVRGRVAGLLHHSDRGSQYASAAYRAALAGAGIACSMSRRRDCWDNAVAESFFATLKSELVHEASWATRDKARDAVVDYIEAFYNLRRRHS